MQSKTSIYLLLGLASAAVAYLAFIINPLSPILVFLFTLILLYPLRKNFYASRLLWISSIIFTLWFFQTTKGLLFPFIVSFTLAYLFDPVVNFLIHRKIPRSVASLTITIFGIGLIVLLMVIIIPLVLSQLKTIGHFLSTIDFDNMQDLIPVTYLENFGIDVDKFEDLLIDFISEQLNSIGNFIYNFFFNIISNFKSAISISIGIVMIPFLSLYFINDFKKVKITIRSLIPIIYRDKYEELTELASTILRQYIRGQTIVVVILISTYCIVFHVSKIPYSLLLGIIFGLMSFIPYIGGIIALTISGIISLLSENTLYNFGVATITYAVVHAIENFLLIPRIIGKKIHLNPIVLLLSIFLFGHFLGIFGVILAIPLSAFLVSLLNRYYI